MVSTHLVVVQGLNINWLYFTCNMMSVTLVWQLNIFITIRRAVGKLIGNDMRINKIKPGTRTVTIKIKIWQRRSFMQRKNCV